jgi:uncharacterized protein YndB with AHSA1/START domain
MVVTSAANSDTFKVTTPSETEIRFTRLFDAPRHLVFEAMTKPEHVKQWWGRLGEGYSVPVCEIDLRVGGAWRFVNRHPKGEAAFHGEYREITPPSRLVFTEIFEEFPDTVSVVTTVLADEGDKTRFTATVSYPTLEVRDMVLGTGMARGAGISYDRLEDLVAELQRS